MYSFVFHIAVIQMQNENGIAYQPQGGFPRTINEYLQDTECCIDMYSNVIDKSQSSCPMRRGGGGIKAAFFLVSLSWIIDLKMLHVRCGNWGRGHNMCKVTWQIIVRAESRPHVFCGHWTTAANAWSIRGPASWPVMCVLAQRQAMVSYIKYHCPLWYLNKNMLPAIIKVLDGACYT